MIHKLRNLKHLPYYRRRPRQDGGDPIDDEGLPRGAQVRDVPVAATLRSVSGELY